MFPLKKMLICTTILSLTLPTVSTNVRAQEEDWSSVASEATVALTTYCTTLKNELFTVPSLQDGLNTMTCEDGKKVVPFFLARLLNREEALKSIENIQQDLEYLNGFCETDPESDGCAGFLREKSNQEFPADTLLDFATYLKTQAEALNATVLANEIKANVGRATEAADKTNAATTCSPPQTVKIETTLYVQCNSTAHTPFSPVVWWEESKNCWTKVAPTIKNDISQITFDGDYLEAFEKGFSIFQKAASTQCVHDAANHLIKDPDSQLLPAKAGRLDNACKAD